MAQMITRCPACGTRFRVVPDQLRISQGWVRCGHCSDVFDAASHLGDAGSAPEAAALATEPLVPDDWPARAARPEIAELQDEPEPPTPAWAETVQLPPDQLPDARDPSDPVEDAPQWLPLAPAEIPVTDPVAPLDVGLAEFVQAQAAGTAEAAAPTVPAAAAASSAADDIAATAATATGGDAPAWTPPLRRRSAAGSPSAPPPAAPSDRLFVALTSESASLPLRPSPSSDAWPLPQRPAVDSAEPPAPAAPRVVAAAPVVRPAPLDPAHAELSFLRDAPSPVTLPLPTRGPARRVRGAWWWAAGLAFVLLAWQWAVHERDSLAASAPGLRPVLDALCAPLGCSVQPLRRIDAIVIDGSSFHALADGGYRLSVTLRNRAAHAVALPAIALALTDISEQAVVRRVLLPQDLGSPPPALDAHGEWTATVELQLADNAGRARVVGYRLDPFYP